MKQRLFLLVNVVLILLFCPFLTKCERRESVGYSDMKHHEITIKDVAYNLLHKYRTALKNGWQGITEETARSITPECYKDIKTLLNNTELLIQYIDAVGKPRSGLLRKNIIWLGSYAECRDISNAHYCTTNLGINVPASPQLRFGALWGLCFPSSCTAQDVGLYLKIILQEVEILTQHQVSLQYSDIMCPPVKPPYTTGVKVTIALCGFLLFLCLIGTGIDFVDETFNISSMPSSKSDITTDENSMITMAPNKSTGESISVEVNGDLTADDVVLLNGSTVSIKARYIFTTFKASFFGQFFCCFSILQNTAKILKTDVPPSAIKSINGIRVISITWVILGHTFSFFGSSLTENKAGMTEDAQLLPTMAISSGTYSVDSFFFLSGLLVAYTCFRKLQKNDGTFNWVLFYVHRFWRLTPSYMFVILFSIYLKGFLTESPFWYTQYFDTMCSKEWWKNLLYINNFFIDAEQCIGWSWYLANDMQFFVITPFLILPLFNVGWRGLVLPLGLLLEAFAITAFIHVHWDLDPLSLLKTVATGLPQKSVQEYMQYVYFKPYCRIQVYLVGFLLGYVMYRYTNTKSRTPGWITTLLGWSVAAVLAMLLVYGPHKSILPGAAKWNETENVLYGTFHRFLWGLVLVWVTYACHYNAGGLVQRFLSARFWIPLSRLTYNVYLIHYIILILMFIGAKGTMHYDVYTATYYFLANVMLSYAAAYVLSVVIEFPFANLEELILKYIRKVRKRGD